ncbi:hypothetical protein GQ42DRAFT_161520 [Ramicandelaber brevisporus]|nr:hypothetical protein GQ42DRAFT_161520 [Ramicandelaber brevisporus]
MDAVSSKAAGVGNGSQNGITARDRAILQVKVQRDKVKQYRRRLQLVVDRETVIAKRHLQANDRRRALLALRKKKYQESLLTKADEQLLTLEQLCATIEFALVEKDIIEGIQTGTEVLEQINKELSLERVEKLMDDTAEAIEYQREVEDALMGALSTVDEAEIEEELDALVAEHDATEAAAIRDKLDQTKVPTKDLPESEVVPSVPTEPVYEEHEEEEEESMEAIPA